MIYNQIAELLLQNQNVDVSKYDEAFLSEAIQERIIKTQSSSPEVYCTLLQLNSAEEEYLIGSLYNSYSEFFRNPLTFSVLERIVLPMLVFKKKGSINKEIRIWSAACAAGQEVYSLAMLMEELKNGDNDKINYRIFATDQCRSNVNESRKGEYSADLINNISLKRINKWFTNVGDVYTVKPILKENIDFSVFDLLGDKLCCPPTSIFGDFDLVVCANLLFYYQPEFQNSILEKVTGCLKNGGYVVSGETERDIFMRNGYREVFPQSAIFKK